MKTTQQILREAKAAASALAVLPTEIKNAALLKMADALEARTDEILSANEQDVLRAKNTLSEVMIDRLRLDERRIAAMAQGIRDVATLSDPVGKVLEETTLPNGLLVTKKRVPIGVIGIIYESRPNVTSDAGALCFKSGNVCVLRGGKEAFSSSLSIVAILREALKSSGLNENFINIVEDSSRESATALMHGVGFIDALIPRGGAGLIRACVENAKVPCIQTGTGICHVFVDESAQTERALSIIENAKTSRPSVCNAEEVCLVHEKIAREFLPLLHERLCTARKEKNLPPVELRCDKTAYEILSGVPHVTKAEEKDFDTEFLDYILAVKVVKDVEEGILHIRSHSTGHSDCIVAEDETVCERFALCVDSAAVYINASTRFTDGGEFGKGCEIGISTQKLHARGPMGLEELCSYKYIVKGRGQVRV
ncbi:MAG: glutamate-5-semialdehyde dehydrogenase [Clostridiales bacterium]|nr:glutamate-5-semialdehyde dehydrogenase [Clostridiales bacterium]